VSEKKLAKMIIEEIKSLLRCRADALDLKSTQKSVEKIIREHKLKEEKEGEHK